MELFLLISFIDLTRGLVLLLLGFQRYLFKLIFLVNYELLA